MVNDQLSDFLTRIRNAGMGRNSKVDVFNSKLNRAVAEILLNEGYVKSMKEVTVDGKTKLRVYLKFENGDLKKPVIHGLRRVSTPGLRRYVHSDKIPKVMSGFGLAILSTSKGVVSDKEARKLGVGGEHLCSVW
jgi:small subunit ribosomal protein S8